jgi:hypothetical protein
MPGNLQSCISVSSSVATLSHSLHAARGQPNQPSINVQLQSILLRVHTSCEEDEDHGRDGPAVIKSYI